MQLVPGRRVPGTEEFIRIGRRTVVEIVKERPSLSQIEKDEEIDFE